MASIACSPRTSTASPITSTEAGSTDKAPSPKQIPTNQSPSSNTWKKRKKQRFRKPITWCDGDIELKQFPSHLLSQLEKDCQLRDSTMPSCVLAFKGHRQEHIYSYEGRKVMFCSRENLEVLLVARYKIGSSGSVLVAQSRSKSGFHKGQAVIIEATRGSPAETLQLGGSCWTQHRYCVWRPGCSISKSEDAAVLKLIELIPQTPKSSGLRKQSGPELSKVITKDTSDQNEDSDSDVPLARRRCSRHDKSPVASGIQDPKSNAEKIGSNEQAVIELLAESEPQTSPSWEENKCLVTANRHVSVPSSDQDNKDYNTWIRLGLIADDSCLI